MAITARHLVKRAPSSRYSLSRSRRPSSPLREFFAGEIGKGDRSFIHLDAGNDALLREHLRHGDAFLRPLTDRLVEQDNAADKFTQAGSREQHLTIGQAVFLSGRNVERFESLPDRWEAFIRS